MPFPPLKMHFFLGYELDFCFVSKISIVILQHVPKSYHKFTEQLCAVRVSYSVSKNDHYRVCKRFQKKQKKSWIFEKKNLFFETKKLKKNIFILIDRGQKIFDQPKNNSFLQTFCAEMSLKACYFKN